MKITLDVHESHIKKQGEKYFSEIEVKKLPVGDVIYQNICIERKEINDFIGSITGKGRVFQQARNMAANFPTENCYIIIVGKQEQAAFNKKIRFSVDQFLAAQASLAQVVSVMTVDNHSQFWKLVRYLFEKGSDGKDRMNVRVARMEKGSGDVLLDMLTCIPKIGEKKAELIVNTFNLENTYPLHDMTIEDIMQVRGIGQKQATEIKKYFPNK